MNYKDRYIEKSRNIHNNKYDYSLVDYKTAKLKVKIICPIHGVFEQKPNNNLSGFGCSKCVIESKILGNNQFIEKSKKIHSDKYDYSLVNYKDSKSKIKIICPIHGVFEQKPNNHLSGNDCPLCSNIKNRKRTINRIKINKLNDNQLYPNYNKEACLLFDKISKENSVFIQHAMNGGEIFIKELGYWVDGYDERNNVVYEYDENQHFDKNGKLKGKDVIRQKEIENLLECEFVRIKK